MSIYDIIPENLFSILASKNKGLYCNALFVVLTSFKAHLKIPKDEMALMIQSQLEKDIDIADFDDEDINENEKGLSGKAHFLIRKLRETGWIRVDYEDDFKEYITIPNFIIFHISFIYRYFADSLMCVRTISAPIVLNSVKCQFKFLHFLLFFLVGYMDV
ncbi:MAG: DUF5716 family protein [Eubacterium sp.]|nr:DUF5716 family protein [Eubacterium sp.]